jgi:CubicO group peptidase (beta-lactamase class C family)
MLPRSPRKELTMNRLLFAILLTSISLIASPAASAEQGPPPMERQAVDAVFSMLTSDDDATLERFISDRMDAGYRSSFSNEDLRTHLQALRASVRGDFEDVAIEGDDRGLLLIFSGSTQVAIRLGLDMSNGLVTELSREAAPERSPEEVAYAEAVDARMFALEAVGMQPDGRELLIAEHLSPEFIQRTSPEALDELLDLLRRAAASAGAISAEGRPEGFLLRLRGSVNADVWFQVDEAPPHLISELWIDTDVAAMEEAEAPSLTWDELHDALSQASREGFAGTVLAIRDGEVVLDRSYGRGNHRDTIYGIGSIPIDFTRAALLVLMQDGAIDLDDRIGEYLEDVPADKRGMTLRHLFEGRSGLPNFHHRSGEDPDLSWIDRATAERRILEQDLMFAPGEGRGHSHSAFVLLAAIIERVSGQPYGEFLAERLFTPLGMTRTGSYGEDLGLPEGAFAPGDGQQAGDPNIPPNWGPTSWLIMGSGGMFSTVPDMQRWFDGLRAGRVLRGEALATYLQRGHASGGSDRGFLFVHAWDRADSMIFLGANAGVNGMQTDVLIRAITTLVDGD